MNCVPPILIFVNCKDRDMNTEVDPRKLILHFEYPAESSPNNSHAIVAVALANSIWYLQKVINLLAKCQMGMSADADLEKDDRNRYSLFCDATLEAGSLSMPLYMGTVHDYADSDVMEVVRMFHRIAKQLSQGNIKRFKKLLPDRNFFQPLVEAYNGMLPSDASGLEFSIRDGNHQSIFTGSGLKQYLREEAVEVEPYFISGFLSGINLKKSEVQVELKTGHHLATCYSEVDNAESVLFGNLGQPIFLYGDVGFNKDDRPVYIHNLGKIHAIDESPIQLSDVKINNSIYRANPPLNFDVKFDSKALLYELEGDFDIYLFDESRDELEASLEDELQFLWNDIGEEKAELLADDALRLQSELRNRLTKSAD